MSVLPPVSEKWLEEVANRRPMGESMGQAHEVPVVAQIDLGYASGLFGVPRITGYLKPDLGVKMILTANELHGADDFTKWGHSVLFVEDYGGKIKWPTGYSHAPYVEEYPLKTPEDVEKLEVKDVTELSKGPTYAYIWKALETAEKLLGNFFNPWSHLDTPYNVARNWLGDDKLLRWTIKKPKLIHKLMKKVVEHEVNVAKAVLRRYGRCSLGTGSVMANSETLSPRLCREFHIVYLKEMVKRVLKAGGGPGVFYHLCGDHSLDWQLHEDVPMTSQTSMHVAYDGRKPMDLTKVIKVFGRKCIIHGNVDTQLMFFGKPKEVYEEAKRQVLSYKNSPKGFVLGLTCELPAGTPPVNVHALIKAARDYGKLSKA